MFDFELQSMPRLVEDRQEYLRSLAAHPPHELDRESARQRAGRTLVRFGRWVEGCRAEHPADLNPHLAGPTPSLAGRSR